MGGRVGTGVGGRVGTAVGGSVIVAKTGDAVVGISRLGGSDNDGAAVLLRHAATSMSSASMMASTARPTSVTSTPLICSSTSCVSSGCEFAACSDNRRITEPLYSTMPSCAGDMPSCSASWCLAAYMSRVPNDDASPSRTTNPRATSAVTVPTVDVSDGTEDGAAVGTADADE